MRKGKKQTKAKEFVVEQEVVRTGVKGQPFDFILRFNNSTEQPELFMDELVKLTLEGLIERYGKVLVKINWWSEGLTVIVPDGIPQSSTTQNALQGGSKGSGSTEGSNPSPNTES